MRAAKPCMTLTPDDPLTMPLHPAEERLLRYIRAIGHGSLEIRIADGYPVVIEQGIKRVKLL
jgi:hypothetical protein